MKNYNTTQLDPLITFEKHVFHRDQFAHYLRWTHVLKIAKIGMKILDFGCGTGNLAEVFYRNKYSPFLYYGIDIRKKTIENNKLKFSNLSWCKFESFDLCTDDVYLNERFDIVTCFEVVEHIGKNNIKSFLKNVKNNMSEGTTLLISTPCFDNKVGAADNHIVNGDIGEFEYDEFKNILLDNFVIINHWGTFASQKDYKNNLDKYPGLSLIYDKLKEYYDSNLVANLMAPLFPEYARNVIWECELKI